MTWLYVGNIFAYVDHQEVAYNSYYIAHLKDHQTIKMNAELQFDTTGAKNLIENAEKTTDEQVIKKLMK